VIAGVSLRRAEAGDVDALADTVGEGFEDYRAFAPDGWKPPERQQFRDELVGLFPRSDFWCLLADANGRPAGHVAFMPAEASRWAISEPGVAHLFQLFVRAPFQGSGLATELMDRAIKEMFARDFSIARLFTPAGQARARRFYEREGWYAAGEPFHPAELGLDLIEYRRRLVGPLGPP
jgi:GNAT superfamily N-acetyltransferase